MNIPDGFGYGRGMWQGRGMGRGRGMGYGRGMGWGRGWRYAAGSPPWPAGGDDSFTRPPLVAKDEIVALKEEAAGLARALEQTRKRIEELESE